MKTDLTNSPPLRKIEIPINPERGARMADLQRDISKASFMSKMQNGMDSDFLPFSYDFQDLPSPGPPHPFEFNDGLPHVAFVSAAESIICDDDLSNLNDDNEQATEKKSFKSKLNPHELKRNEQLSQGYVWFATYNELMLSDYYQSKLCPSQSISSEEKYLKALGF